MRSRPPAHARRGARVRPAARRIAEVLEGAGGPLTAQEVADALGQHHTSVRTQLAALEKAGVAEAVTDAPHGRGRPVRRYSLVDRSRRPGGRGASRARADSSWASCARPASARRDGALRRGPGLERADRGRRGRRASGRVRAHGVRTARGARAEPGRPLSSTGARSPMGSEAPGGELICLLHRGLARGIAARAAPEVTVTELVVEDPRRAGCRLCLSAGTDERTGVPTLESLVPCAPPWSTSSAGWRWAPGC